MSDADRTYQGWSQRKDDFSLTLNSRCGRPHWYGVIMWPSDPSSGCLSASASWQAFSETPLGSRLTPGAVAVAYKPRAGGEEQQSEGGHPFLLLGGAGREWHSYISFPRIYLATPEKQTLRRVAREVGTILGLSPGKKKLPLSAFVLGLLGIIKMSLADLGGNAPE